MLIRASAQSANENLPANARNPLICLRSPNGEAAALSAAQGD